ncbi:MAG: hypothetical protein LCI00_21820 [Chloroflexi bacterium]|nr:hypothetical protein [Chloroflexota bacterium]MCC6894965.1 hypothetical protein [Anaerolineae bacterium]
MVEQVSTNIRLAKMTEHGKDIDSRLPVWSRRTNPLVRRELGVAWRTMLPEVEFMRQAFVVQTVLIALTLPFPFIIELALPTVTAAIILLPFAMVVYARLLILVGSAGARSMTHEIQNDTLNVLRSTPFSLREIIFSKAAASMWRQVEDLGLLMLGVTLLSTPLLISHYGTMWSMNEYPLVTRAAFIFGLAVAIIRMVLEPFMMAMIGVFMGAALKTRPAATAGTLVVGAFYFMCLNLARLIPMAWPVRFVLDFVLPVVIPIGMTWLVIYLTDRLVDRG